MNANKLKIRYCHPRYWLTWMGILALFLSSLLPFSLLLLMGKLLGRCGYYIAKSRRRIAHRNIELCFPDFSTLEVEQKVMHNFENAGIALFEMAMAWFWPSWRIRSILKVRGLEHLQQAKQNGKGIIFLGAHFLTLEMGGRGLGLTNPTFAVYRKHSNPVLDYYFHWGRMRNQKGMVDRKDLKGMIRILKEGESLWYAPDHDYGRHKSSVFAPFFNVENANTVAGTSTLARVKNSCVIPAFLRRLPESRWL
ncbi:LpxL/LpxP family Kdo(2)-lipid IV(A) lauroyl/palmitoleoyl acyltransferase [Psychromonas sp. MME2]|uniref:LpxL/LpxP family Kdo(2)-lipid IV(A) lauroyl/palmitoleoyl acyltransferase n=1 Tax=Psychromonas sp. MME2 TaxID=3231033 RepID=UPI00339BA988